MSPERNRGPASPNEALELQTELIPNEVFEVFNELIARNLQNGKATVLQKDVLEQLDDMRMKRDEIFSKHWLDVENSYRTAGWKVAYDSPVGYAGETFNAYFTFSTKQCEHE